MTLLIRIGSRVRTILRVRVRLALRMRCSQCGKNAAEVVAVATPRPRGVAKNPH